MDERDAAQIYRLIHPLRRALLEVVRQLHATGVLDVAEMRTALRREVPPGTEDRIHLAVLDLCRELEAIAPPVKPVPPRGAE